jgi:hypothetical protein
MLVLGLGQAAVAFFFTLANLILGTKMKIGSALVFTLTYLELVGTGVVSSVAFVPGLIIDPWYVADLFLLSSIVGLSSALLMNNMGRDKDSRSKISSISNNALKLQHARFLVLLQLATWVTVIATSGYLAAVFLVSPTTPRVSQLFATDVVGVIYIIIGISLGLLWQLIRRIELLEGVIK